MKKITLITLAAATAMFMACGDDSSSGTSGESGNNSKSVKDLMEAVETLDCDADHECETVFLEESGTYAECHANAWSELFTGKSIVCPENDFTSSSSEADEEDLSSDSDEEDIESSDSDDESFESKDTEVGGKSSSSEQGQIIEESAGSGDGESSSSEEQGPTGALVSCEVTVEGSFGEHSCAEAAEGNSSLPALCQQIASFGDGMSATEGTSCNAPATAIKCVKNGMNFYILDDKESCDEFYEATVFQTLVGTSVSM